MARLTIAARIVLIAVLGIIVAWTIMIAVYYRIRVPETNAVTPAPERIAAVVALVERTPPAERADLFKALTTASFVPSIVAEPDASPDLPLADPELIAGYQAALGQRTLQLVVPENSLFRRLPAARLAQGQALEFRIHLRTGEWLVIDTASLFTLTWFGLPVGYGAAMLGTLLAFATLLLALRETRPLSRLAAAVDRFDLTDRPVDLPRPRRSAPEIKALIGAFDRLQARLNQLLAARMAMITGISHDVRTFAARLRLRVEQIPDAAERERAVGDIADMIRLLDDALLAGRAGSGEQPSELLDLADCLREEVDDRRATGADVTLDLREREALVIGDRLAIRRIFGNLIENAVKYGGSARITLQTERMDESAVHRVTVDDRGPGIPVERRASVLEPFVRLEGSRNRATGGAGLGLAIARTLTDAHGGTLAIDDAPEGGARVIVRLPAFVPSETD
ncbi:Sensor protein RstB [Hartmannibacter diazotrophicus]|uniref:histidine kinase n=1 Tax=Hartmannibacter diazotrophicus TaxID=1482074 RepID=A0A2C9D2C2_9HYPH|nr:ATP-binding protein [Hartmannibacter diazotrophicus]SON54406.1 Sensor protein RstB [Hartmannibacter diazotrophicus]